SALPRRSPHSFPTRRSSDLLFGINLPEHFDLEEWAASLRNKPAQNTMIFATAAAIIFYYAERGQNPKVNDYYDALVYCTTNLSRSEEHMSELQSQSNLVCRL